VRARYPQAQLAIIGEGRMRQELEALVARLGLADAVFLLGAREDALQYVRAFDAFVMPSLSEGLPLALLEGMSGHLPVIGSDIPSLKPILEDCGGRLFPSGQPDLLAAIMMNLLAMTKQERDEEGARSYAYLRRAHDIEDFRRHYLKLVEEGVGNERRFS